MTIINEQTVVTQRYIRDGMTPKDAYAKARDVLEILADLRECDPTTPDAELFRQAEREWLIGEEALSEYVEQIDRPAALSISRRMDGFYLQRGRQGMFITGREIAALLDQAKRQLTLDRKARKATRIHARRLAEGRDPWTPRVVGGRKVA